LQSSFCTGKTGSGKGFAISLDALLATILTISAIAFLGLGLQPQEAGEIVPITNIKQSADYAFTALENSGIITQKLANAEMRNDIIEEIYNEAKGLLPENSNLKLVVNEYRIRDLAECQTAYKSGGPIEDVFDECFGPGSGNPAVPMATEEFGPELPTGKEIVHGRKIALTKQPKDLDMWAGQCYVCNGDSCPGDIGYAKEAEEEIEAMFQGELETDIETWIDVDATEISCDQPATVTIRARNATREPIAMVLAMDESGSMGTYDMLQQETSGSFNDGTCQDRATNCIADVTNCDHSNENYTGWQNVGSFQVSQGLLDKMAFDNGGLQVLVTPTTGNICGRVPKIKVVAPDTTEFHKINDNDPNDDHYINISKTDLQAHDIPPGGNWQVFVWSNIERTNERIYTKTYDGSYTLTLEGGTLSGGQKTGSGEECVVPDDLGEGNWQYLTEFDIDETQATQVYARMYYTGYEGECAPKIKLKAPDGSWAPYGNESCPDSPEAGQTCYRYFSCGIDAPYCQTGRYEIWGWSDDLVTDVDAGHYKYVFVDNIAQGITISNGTCDGETCDYAGDNCPGADYDGLTDRQTTGTFEITEEMIGNYVTQIVRSNYVTGACDEVPKIRAIKPNGEALVSYFSTYPAYYSGLYPDTGWWLETWSNQSVITDFYMRPYNVYNEDSITINATAEDCEDDSGSAWDLVKQFNVSDNTKGFGVELDFYFTYYGTCGTSKIKMETPSRIFKIPLSCTVSPCIDSGTVGNLDYDIQCDRSRCKFSLKGDDNVGGPLYLEEGLYKLYTWSDRTIVMVDFVVKNQLEFKVVDNVTLQGGTCYNEQCQGNLPSNCSSKTNWIDEAGSDDLDVFEIEAGSHLTGLKITIDRGGYWRNCEEDSPAFRLRRPEPPEDNFEYFGSDCYGKKATSCEKTIEVIPPSSLEEGRWELEGWSDYTVSYGLNWIIQRVDAAKKAAKAFIDNAEWKESDQIGLVSFSNQAEIDQNLTDIADSQDLKDSLNFLSPGGQTGLADAISEASDALIDVELGTAKFIVLLTDGKANICSGGVACNEADAAQGAKDVAENARDLEITVYIIGFAEQQEMQEYEETLKEIAKDKDSAYCGESEEFCGKYFYAADEQELEELYNRIALEIARGVNKVDISLPFGEGYDIVPGNCGFWNGTDGGFSPGGVDGTLYCSGAQDSSDYISWNQETGELAFKDQALGGLVGDNWWAAEFEVTMLCSTANCDENSALFPPRKTVVEEEGNDLFESWDGEEYSTIECGAGENTKCHKRVPFKYSDLNVSFKSVERMGTSALWVALEIDNNGYKDIQIGSDPLNGLQVSLYKNNFENKIRILGTPYVWFGEERGNADQNSYDYNVNIAPPEGTEEMCSAMDSCAPDTNGWQAEIYRFLAIGCSDSDCTGTIIAKINGNKKIAECSKNNLAFAYCNTESEPRFYTIDYYAWVD